MVAPGFARTPVVGVVGAEITVVKTLAGAGTVEVAPFKIGTPAVAVTVPAAVFGCVTPAGTAATVAPTLAATGVIVIVPPEEVGATLLRSPRS